MYGVLLVAALTLVTAGAQSVGASVWDGVFTEDQAKRGEAAYLQECANCHGPGLEGGDMTPALVGGVFTSNWNDLTLGDLFERIRLTMPLDNPGKLSRQQNTDVIAFLLKANAWPKGSTELAADLGVLKQVKIEANKR
jgi:quinoprotein glucose dehydrogenase